MLLQERKFREALYLIQHAKNLPDVLDIWATYSEYLDSARLIYSHVDPVGMTLPLLAWPLDLFRSGALRSLFAHPYLYFIDNQILMRMASGEQVEIKVDSSISFDTNAASYVEKFVSNKRAGLPPDFLKALKFVIEMRPNFDYTFYLIENTPNYKEPDKAVRIREKLLAILKLDNLDREYYDRTGEIEPTLSPAQLESLADEKLHQFYVVLKGEPQSFTYEHWHEILYVMLLKIVEIEYCRSGSISLVSKMEQLFNFMHEELSTYFDRLTIIALKLFQNRNSLSFFDPLNPGGSTKDRDKLRKVLKGMAWDFTLLQMMDRLSAMKMSGDFFIPLFLSTDRKLLRLFEAHPIQSSVAHGEQGQVVPLPKKDSREVLAADVGKDFADIYFSEEMVRLRLSGSQAALESAPSRFLPMLESKVLDCLG